MRHVPLRPLKTLEIQNAEDTFAGILLNVTAGRIEAARPQKAILPAWLLETFVAPGPHPTERGDLDFDWLAAECGAGAQS